MIGTYDELYALNEIKSRSPWEALVTVESLREAFDDMDAIWKLLLEKSGIQLIDTLSSWSGGMTYEGDA